MYDVGFADGVILEYAANVIAESLFAQVDPEGRRCVLMSEIVDHRKKRTQHQRMMNLCRGTASI
jgi:hypothetical protein